MRNELPIFNSNKLYNLVKNKLGITRVLLSTVDQQKWRKESQGRLR